MALRVGDRLVVDDDRDRQPLHAAHRLFGMADRLVELVVGRLVLAVADRRGLRCVLAVAGDDRRGGRLRRRVRQRARHARRAALREFGRAAGLLAADRGLLRRAVRAVAFRRLLDLREIEIRADLRARVAGAEDRREDRVDALLGVVLDLLHVLELARVEAGRGRGLGQQVAVLVDDRHVLGRHVGHAGRHHPRDRLHLALVEHAARVEVDEHRRARRFLVAHEHRRLRDREMHARAAHGVDRFDGALQFAFERALVVDLLGELADAEFLVVHQLEADRAALRQPHRGELQACFVHLARRHQDRAAGIGELVGNVCLLERGDDRAAVAVRQVAVQHAVVGRPAPQHERGDRGDRERDGDHERQLRVALHSRDAGNAFGEAAQPEVRACAARARQRGGRGGAGRRAEARAGVWVDQRVGLRIHASSFSGAGRLSSLGRAGGQ
ncbi:hypothetical protein P355_2135 [Burkholderia cenocepacia KC-01]|nr:hypothetical protein P355_2135 [Burkholderia cenocepacia KC-01]